MEKVKLRIPVVVTKTGALAVGAQWRNSGEELKEDYSFCYDQFDDKDYNSGTALVHVSCELDIAEIFKSMELSGIVEAPVARRTIDDI